MAAEAAIAARRDGEYFGQFWGSGVPKFAGAAAGDLQPAARRSARRPQPGEWCATWAWTQQPAANKRLRPAPRAAAPLDQIDEAIGRLQERSTKNNAEKIKAMRARRQVLNQKPYVPEHGPRGFGSSIRTDRGAVPRPSGGGGGGGGGGDDDGDDYD